MQIKKILTAVGLLAIVGSVAVLNVGCTSVTTVAPDDEDGLLAKIEKETIGTEARGQALRNYFDFKYQEVLSNIANGVEFKISDDQQDPKAIIQEIGDGYTSEIRTKLAAHGVVRGEEGSDTKDIDYADSKFMKQENSKQEDTIDTTNHTINLKDWTYRTLILHFLNGWASYLFEDVTIKYSLV